MSPARRYRLALLAYPRSYRRVRQAELESTLVAADAARGRPSSGEAFDLVRGGIVARLRSGSTPLGASALALIAGLVLLASAFSPGGVWGHRSDPSSGGLWLIAGPSPWMRVVLVAIAVLGIAVVVSARRGRSVSSWSLALLVGSLGAATIAGVVLRAPAGGSSIQWGQVAAGVVVACAVTVAVPAAASALMRVSMPARLWLTAGVVAAVATPIVFSVLATRVGPAGVAASVGALLAFLAMAAGAAWRNRVSPADPLETRR